MGFLNFLKSVEVEAVAAPAKKAGGGKSKQWNPNASILAIRLWSSGAVYPSQALVDKFDLEYRTATITRTPIDLKEGETEEDRKYKNEYYYISGPGNAFDIIDSRNWNVYKADGHALFISPVGKDEKKVDIFGSVGYNEDGTPKTSVMQQGAVTYGKENLLKMVKEVYGIELSEDKPYVDLIVFSEFEGTNLTQLLSKDIAYFPKTVNRGSDKGKPDYVKREKAQVYGLAPAELLGMEEAKETEEEATVDSAEAALQA